MKFNLRKISILGLIAVFFLSALLCCCMTRIVEAREPVSSCHQSSRDEGTPQNNEECNCFKAIGIAENCNIKSYERTASVFREFQIPVLVQKFVQNLSNSSSVVSAKYPDFHKFKNPVSIFLLDSSFLI